jgi:hypothetical protein
MRGALRRVAQLLAGWNDPTPAWAAASKTCSAPIDNRRNHLSAVGRSR